MSQDGGWRAEAARIVEFTTFDMCSPSNPEGRDWTREPSMQSTTAEEQKYWRDQAEAGRQSAIELGRIYSGPIRVAGDQIIGLGKAMKNLKKGVEPEVLKAIGELVDHVLEKLGEMLGFEKEFDMSPDHVEGGSGGSKSEKSTDSGTVRDGPKMNQLD